MDHLLTRVGGRSVLVVDVCASADGHGVGYGIILKRIERALRFGAAMGVSVFFIREARSINTAIFRLRSDDVEILSRRGLTAWWLRCLWLATSPFRLGAPGLWVRRMAARVLLGPAYEWAERAHWLPRRLRRFMLRPRPLVRALKAANSEYASLSSRAWKQQFKQHASVRLRAAEREGIDVPLRLELPAAADAEAVRAAARVGIRPEDRLITVHVRESGYRATAGLRQRPLDLLRNARIETYEQAFRALAARGYTVVRLGDSTMTPVAPVTGVVDLAHSPHRTEWLETWCIKRSQFLIGCDSGPSWLAFLLGVPVLTVNALHFRDMARAQDRMICKLARERATGRALSVADMLTETYVRNGLDTSRYEHVDNDPADIADAAIDMIAVAAGEEQPAAAQLQFVERLLALRREVPHEWTGLQGVAISGEPRGTLSRRFAEKYWRSDRPDTTSG